VDTDISTHTHKENLLNIFFLVFGNAILILTMIDNGHGRAKHLVFGYHMSTLSQPSQAFSHETDSAWRVVRSEADRLRGLNNYMRGLSCENCEGLVEGIVGQSRIVNAA
jgi:hypothetical protein